MYSYRNFFQLESRPIVCQLLDDRCACPTSPLTSHHVSSGVPREAEIKEAVPSPPPPGEGTHQRCACGGRRGAGSALCRSATPRVCNLYITQLQYYTPCVHGKHVWWALFHRYCPWTTGFCHAQHQAVEHIKINYFATRCRCRPVLRFGSAFSFTSIIDLRIRYL